LASRILSKIYYIGIRFYNWYVYYKYEAWLLKLFFPFTYYTSMKFWLEVKFELKFEGWFTLIFCYSKNTGLVSKFYKIKLFCIFLLLLFLF
jgi:hypothetical protein